MKDGTEKKSDGKGRGGNPPPVAFQWKPGQSGNPAGRKKGVRNRSTIFRIFLDADYVSPDGDKIFHPEGSPYAGEPITVGEYMAMQAISLGIYGDKDARKEALDSAYGKNPDIVISDPDQVAKIIDHVDDPGEAARMYEDLINEAGG